MYIVHCSLYSLLTLDSGDHISVGVDGPMFRVGSVGSEMDSSASGTHNDPNSFAWCLMNLGVSKLLMASVRKVLSTAGVEVIGEWADKHE